MEVKIKDFAKIKEADIRLDGITVIAGENNSGKSTVGKVVYAVFQALNGIDERIEEERRKEFFDITNALTIDYYYFLATKSTNEPFIGLERIKEISSRIIKEIESMGIMEEDTLLMLLQKYFSEKYFMDWKVKQDDYIKQAEMQISGILKISNQSLQSEIVERMFCELFSSQVNCLLNMEDANLVLNDKKNKIEIAFRNNRCLKCTIKQKVNNNAYYIASPYVIDKLYSAISGVTVHWIQKMSTDDSIVSKLLVQNADIMSGIFNSVIAKEKLTKIYELLDDVVDGTISFDGKEFLLSARKFKEPLKISNLSAGLKSFTLIKMLLEKGALKDNDILILDEPEIHLHPEWQLKYAQMIVLLQKAFDLNILVTTHSAHFLDAIDFYSKKYKIQEKCNYYLTSMQEGMSTFECVNGNLEKIYSQLVEPSVLLDKLKYEQEMEDEYGE